MNIIGINGYKRSGKGEVGRAIDVLTLGVKQLGFADKLKVFAARSLGYTELPDSACVALMDVAKEEWFMDVARYGTWDPKTDGNAGRISTGWTTLEPVKQWTVRQLLQYMGTEARNVFGEDFWVDQVLPEPTPGYEYADLELSHKYPGAETLAFTDLRFPNEAQRIVGLGGFNIEVLRASATSDGHASEQRLPRALIKHVIHNDGTLDELKWEVNKVLELEGLMP